MPEAVNITPDTISIHAPHTGRDRSLRSRPHAYLYFNPRAPYGARPVPFVPQPQDFGNFNPRAPYGARLHQGLNATLYALFQSTRPIRGATRPGLCWRCPVRFQSTRPIRGATVRHCRRTGAPAFQSTRPIRGATCKPDFHGGHFQNFNPRAPYGARRSAFTSQVSVTSISIHAPHTGRDKLDDNPITRFVKFQSTRPIRGATPLTAEQCSTILFQSTRPIRGATEEVEQAVRRAVYFNPRAPYGARQQKCIIYVLHFCNNRQSKHKNQQETSSVRTFF